MVSLTDAERLDITYAVVEDKPVVPLVEAIVAARVEAERDRLLARIEELADEFVLNVDWSAGRSNYGDNDAWEAAAQNLRALVAEERAR